MSSNKIPCPICASETLFLGIQPGVLDGRYFNFRQCNYCFFSFVENPRDDFEEIYNEEYYKGKGADQTVDYVFEHLHQSKTIRNYEWQSIVLAFEKLCPDGGQWLDFGCGSGGLVRYASSVGKSIVGFEEGWAARLGKASSSAILNSADLDKFTHNFDFITAIEVLEHVSDPVDVLIKIRKLLKPGGKLFITTGNAKPWREKLLQWDYSKCPDVHISFYEPESLAKALEKSGFISKRFFSYELFFTGIIKYKILKSLRIKQQSKLLNFFPWGLIARIVNIRYAVTHQPYGIAKDDL